MTAPMVVRVDVFRADDADVFVGTSPDLDGLVVEAGSVAQLEAEARLAVEMLLGHAGLQADVRLIFRAVDF